MHKFNSNIETILVKDHRYNSISVRTHIVQIFTLSSQKCIKPHRSAFQSLLFSIFLGLSVSLLHLKSSLSPSLSSPYICCTYTRQIFWGDSFSEKHSALKERKKRSNNKSQITERAVAVSAMKRSCKRCNHITIPFASCCPQ